MRILSYGPRLLITNKTSSIVGRENIKTRGCICWEHKLSLKTSTILLLRIVRPIQN